MKEGEQMNRINPLNNNTLRLVGIASGLDTDMVVQQLMTIEKLPLAKLQRQKQLTECKLEAYREFTNALRSFKEQFFDIAKRTSYLLSENSFRVFKVSSSDEYVAARGTTSAQAGSHTVKVERLATAARAAGNEGVSKPITGDISSFDFENDTFAGKTIKVTLDGVTREITLESYSDENDLAEGIQELLNNAFGTDNGTSKITVTADNGKIKFETNTAAGATRLVLSRGTVNDGLSALGIAPGATNRISTGSTLGELAESLNYKMEFDENDNISFTINGKGFTFSKKDTLQKVMSTINNDEDANVILSYDEIKDRFVITAKQTGAGENIVYSDSVEEGGFFRALGLDGAEIQQGDDARVIIDNVVVVRSTNTFTVNGVEYTLKNVHEGENSATITIEQDIDTVFNSIKSFVDEYNKLVDMFNTKLSEKYDRNYPPLTDDEKEAMTEEQIKKWEERAKTGLLRNDPILEEIQRNMRTALIDVVEGVGINLASIGISSSSYLDKGRLNLDEDKLKQALRERPDEVRNLFIKTSDSVPLYDRNLTAEQRSARYREQGLLFRISDILNDYISTIRDKDGKKGILLEKAGMVGDLSEFNSSLAKEISSYDEKITEMYNKLIVKEESYYQKFTQLEKYMSQMNSQLNWLLSQLGAFQQW